MKIQIIDDKRFKITQQQRRNGYKPIVFNSDIGIAIKVISSCYPDVVYYSYNTIKLYVRGTYCDRDNRILKVKEPKHLKYMIQALKEFCTFNDESFEIEPCIL